jgi:hypothetical protein
VQATKTAAIVTTRIPIPIAHPGKSRYGIGKPRMRLTATTKTKKDTSRST